VDALLTDLKLGTGTVAQHAARLGEPKMLEILLDHVEADVIAIPGVCYSDSMKPLPAVSHMVLAASRIFDGSIRDKVMALAEKQEAQKAEIKALAEKAEGIDPMRRIDFFKEKLSDPSSDAYLVSGYASLLLLTTLVDSVPVDVTAAVLSTGKNLYAGKLLGPAARENIFLRLGQLCLLAVDASTNEASADVARRKIACFCQHGLDFPMVEHGGSIFYSDAFVELVKGEANWNRLAAFLTTTLPFCRHFPNLILENLLCQPRITDSISLRIVNLVIKYRRNMLVESDSPVIATMVYYGREKSLEALLSSGIPGLKENAAACRPFEASDLRSGLAPDKVGVVGDAVQTAAYFKDWKMLRLLIHYFNPDLDAVYAGPLKRNEIAAESPRALISRLSDHDNEKKLCLLAIKAAATKAAKLKEKEAQGPTEDEEQRALKLQRELEEEEQKEKEAAALKAQKQKKRPCKPPASKQTLVVAGTTVQKDGGATSEDAAANEEVFITSATLPAAVSVTARDCTGNDADEWNQVNEKKKKGRGSIEVATPVGSTSNAVEPPSVAIAGAGFNSRSPAQKAVFSPAATPYIHGPPRVKEPVAADFRSPSSTAPGPSSEAPPLVSEMQLQRERMALAMEAKLGYRSPPINDNLVAAAPARDDAGGFVAVGVISSTVQSQAPPPFGGAISGPIEDAESVDECCICCNPFEESRLQMTLHDNHKSFCAVCIEDIVSHAAKARKPFVACPICCEELSLDFVKASCELARGEQTRLARLRALNQAQQALISSLETLIKLPPSASPAEALLQGSPVLFSQEGFDVTISRCPCVAGITSCSDVGPTDTFSSGQAALKAAQDALFGAQKKLSAVSTEADIAEALRHGRPVTQTHTGLTVTIAAKALGLS
jgi:hypothetical protein